MRARDGERKEEEVEGGTGESLQTERWENEKRLHRFFGRR